MNTIDNKILEELFTNRQLRKETLGKDILWFISFYFTEYLKYETAPFQKEILKLIQNLDYPFTEIIAFRGSAKSTYCSLVLPIFSVVGKHQKKNIWLVGQTQLKSEQNLLNIRQEWESNDLLRKDFGPINYESDPWNQHTLVFGRYGARISAVSVEKSIRGLRHRQHRPDLIICDDIEDVQLTKTTDARDKLWQFVNGELIPAGDLNTNYLFVGNLVHEDSIMVRLKKAIESKRLNGVCKEYPLLNDKEKSLWKGKYPDKDAINKLQHMVVSEIDYLREYLLKIVPAGDRIIFREDIHRYEEKDLLPRADFQFNLILIDPAVSLQHTADKTAIITAKVYGSGKNLAIYIQPHPINKRMSWPDIIKTIDRTVNSFGSSTYKIFVEGAATQKGLAQFLQAEGFNAEEVTPQGMDKGTRLSMTRRLLQNSTILFPTYGTEELEIQLITFGTERYDDLVDALTLITLQMHDIKNHLSSGTLMIPNTLRDSVYLYSRNEDWADQEDKEIFGR